MSGAAPTGRERPSKSMGIDQSARAWSMAESVAADANPATVIRTTMCATLPVRGHGTRCEAAMRRGTRALW